MKIIVTFSGFQFYDSPIKSLPASYAPASIGDFNSMIVRLKGLCKRHHKKIHAHFNSMIVRLKVLRNEPCAPPRRRFQFYDSPIKSPKKKRKRRVVEGFNSMIVRLKVTYLLKRLITRVRFQFYDSPIKSPCGAWKQCDRSKFQFYDSPIKRMN